MLRSPACCFALVAMLAGSAAGTATASPAATSCVRVRAEARTGTAEQVMLLFVTSGVLGVNPACAYDLVTPNVRKQATRAAFAARKAPIAVYRTKRPKSVIARYVPRVKLSDQVGSWITLDAPDLPPRTFEIVMRKRGGRWLVDYWDRAVGFN